MMMRRFDSPHLRRSITNTRARPSCSHGHSHGNGNDHGNNHGHDQRHSPSHCHGPFAISCYFPAHVPMTTPATAARRCMDQPQLQLLSTSRSGGKQGVAMRSAQEKEEGSKAEIMSTGPE